MEYFRGIANPVGIKAGPTTDATELVQLIRALNPQNEAGKIMIITRFGAAKVAAKLPSIIQAVQKAGLSVVWECDPMHGNTRSTTTGLKTRNFDDILAELLATFDVHTRFVKIGV